MRRKHHRLPKPHQAAIRSIVLLTVIVAVFAAFCIVSRILENQGPSETRGDFSAWQADVPTMLYQGKRYQARTRITNVLLIGVDKEEGTAQTGGGQADFLLLLVIDDAAKTITPLQIDRDTMTEITVMNVLGTPTGTRRQQISLSHGFGKTAEQSCKLTADAVSHLLLGTKIDYYAAIALDGISVLNDAVGGITVTLEDDFSSLDSMMKPGVTLTLQGDQAEYYVRQRYGIADSSNRARMIRQENYLTQFRTALDVRILGDAALIGTLFDNIEPYMTTDIKRGRMINLAWNTKDYTRVTLCRLDGEHSIGSDGFMEFNADKASLENMVIHLFYRPDE